MRWHPESGTTANYHQQAVMARHARNPASLPDEYPAPRREVYDAYYAQLDREQAEREARIYRLNAAYGISLGQPCPTCSAAKSEACVAAGGGERSRPHATRVQLAQRELEADQRAARVDPDHRFNREARRLGLPAPYDVAHGLVPAFEEAA